MRLIYIASQNFIENNSIPVVTHRSIRLRKLSFSEFKCYTLIDTNAKIIIFLCHIDYIGIACPCFVFASQCIMYFSYFSVYLLLTVFMVLFLCRVSSGKALSLPTAPAVVIWNRNVLLVHRLVVFHLQTCLCAVFQYPYFSNT